MEVAMVMVTSLDGRITKGETAGTAWASPEDQAAFNELKAEYHCIVMGATTYRAARDFMRPTADKPRFILTHNPDGFAEDTDKPGLVFTDADPQEILEMAAAKGCEKVMLAGGSATNALFLNAGLVDNAYITVEPLIIGEGLPLAAPLTRPVGMQLIEATQLNEPGTILLHYQIIKPKDV